MDGNKPPATILTGSQITLFFFISDSANNIEIDLKTVLLAAMRTKFRCHLYPLFYLFTVFIITFMLRALAYLGISLFKT